KRGELRNVLVHLEKELAEKSVFLPALEKIKLSLEKEKEFVEAKMGMGEEGSLSYLKGYVPEESTEKILMVAHEQAWGILVEAPSPEDSVPTLLRNFRAIEILNPLFRFLGILPGYQELDISFWFLIFLSLFFGMLIGDAGYGVIYLLLSFLIKKKWGNKIKEKSLFTLFYLLSFSAIIWGLLSGTIFGQAWLSRFIKPLLPALRDNRRLQSFCFFLGALHLSIAHLWKFILKIPGLSALSEGGWMAILWGVYFLARTLILGETFPYLGKSLFLLGVILILFFTKPQKNIIKGIAQGTGAIFLNLVGNFTDVVSYIRLFAVGLASVTIADAFNQLALDFGYRGFFSGLFGSLILFLGHTLNVLLGPLSVLVHGIRLNLLEFCNHLEVKWIGFAYKPLKK
ncbi:MAG: V-type ATP synthase subunit I, partial [Candidatus Omnitrophota bacterium]